VTDGVVIVGSGIVFVLESVNTGTGELAVSGIGFVLASVNIGTDELVVSVVLLVLRGMDKVANGAADPGGKEEAVVPDADVRDEAEELSPA
jgi:hypothetical protein